MSINSQYFTILSQLEEIQNHWNLKEQYDKVKEILNLRNYIFGELISLGETPTRIKDIEFDDPEFDYLVLKDVNGKSFKCRQKFINKEITPITVKAPEIKPVEVAVENSKPTEIKEEVVIEKPVAKENSKQPEVSTEPAAPRLKETKTTTLPESTQKELSNITGFYQTEIELTAPTTSNIEIKETQEVNNSINNYYKEVTTGKTIASIPQNDLTIEFKDITITNPIKRTSKIVNLSSAPLTVEDNSDSNAMFFIEGLGDNPCLAHSTVDNPTAKIEADDEIIGISGNWKNSVFGTNIMSLTDSTIHIDPNDSLVYQNDKHDIGHCVVEITTASNKKVYIHGFPLSMQNNDKGTTDSMLCIMTDNITDTKHLTIDNPIYKLYNREFEAKIMTYWEKDIFNMSVDVIPKA